MASKRKPSQSAVRHPVRQPPTSSSNDYNLVEKLLKVLSHDEIRSLADSHHIDARSVRRSVPSKSTGWTAHPSPHTTVATREDIARNTLHFEPLSADLVGIEKFLPEFKNETPARVVKVLTKRFTKHPTPPNGALLQLAMNRYTSSHAPDGELKEAIKEAMTAFRKPSESEKLGGTDDISYTAWVDQYYGGASQYFDLPQGYISGGYRYVGSAMNDNITSLQASCSSNEVGAQVILFENSSFWGRYQNWSLDGGGSSEDVFNVGSAFNDITSSTLIVRRFANQAEPITVSSLFPPGAFEDIWNSQVLFGSNGGTIFTWDLLPTGPTSGDDWHPNAPTMNFVYVIVPLQVDPEWPNNDWYDAEARYWIYFYVDGSGKLNGSVAYSGYWVTGGSETGDVAGLLQDTIPATIASINALVTQAVNVVNIGAPYRFVYYLPGLNQFSGNTFDDVTMIAVKQPR
jgi:hypothetical protein